MLIYDEKLSEFEGSTAQSGDLSASSSTGLEDYREEHIEAV